MGIFNKQAPKRVCQFRSTLRAINKGIVHRMGEKEVLSEMLRQATGINPNFTLAHFSRYLRKAITRQL